MGKLTPKEQALLTYYIYNFVEDTEPAMQELETVLIESLRDDYTKIVEALNHEGLTSRTQEDNKKRITNEGIVYIDNILHIQSEATERNKLAYVKDSLLINEIELSIDILKEYIHHYVGIDIETNN